MFPVLLTRESYLRSISDLTAPERLTRPAQQPYCCEQGNQQSLNHPQADAVLECAVSLTVWHERDSFVAVYCGRGRRRERRSSGQSVILTAPPEHCHQMHFIFSGTLISGPTPLLWGTRCRGTSSWLNRASRYTPSDLGELSIDVVQWQ